MEEGQMINRMIIIGGSAGSLHAILSILENLRANFPFPILLVLHRHSKADSMLVSVLSARSRLIASEIEEKDIIEPGHIYVCPADYHVLIEKNETFSLDMSEKIHFSRPSLDVVFKSVADIFTTRTVGIILSGANADGAMGMQYIQEKAGITVVQRPIDAQVSYMPDQALKIMTPEYILDTEEIAEFLNSLPAH